MRSCAAPAHVYGTGCKYCDAREPAPTPALEERKSKLSRKARQKLNLSMNRETKRRAQELQKRWGASSLASVVRRLINREYVRHGQRRLARDLEPDG